MAPNNGTILVNDKHIRISVAAPSVVHTVFFDHFGHLIIEDRKLQSQGFDCETGLRKIVNTDCQNLGVQIGKL